MPELLIVGAGLTGATIARAAVDHGISVEVYERRSEVGGNLRDWVHPESGWRIHRHGPHFFRTNNTRIFEFVKRFATWRKFEATLSSVVNVDAVPFPPSRNWVDAHYGPVEQHFENPRNLEEAWLNLLPKAAYQDLIANYVLKQWGMPASQLSPTLVNRHGVRPGDGDPRLKTSKYQTIPVQGYSTFISNMLDGVPVHLSCFEPPKAGPPSATRYDLPLVWTGGIDHFFEFRHGRLPYRTQRREHKWSYTTTSIYRTTAVVYPDPKYACIRATFWNDLQPYQAKSGTLYTLETPADATNMDEAEYPCPTWDAQQLYLGYKGLAEKVAPNVIFAGRLGGYAYLDMDQAIGQALALFRKRLLPNLRPGAAILDGYSLQEKPAKDA